MVLVRALHAKAEREEHVVVRVLGFVVERSAYPVGAGPVDVDRAARVEDVVGTLVAVQVAHALPLQEPVSVHASIGVALEHQRSRIVKPLGGVVQHEARLTQLLLQILELGFRDLDRLERDRLERETILDVPRVALKWDTHRELERQCAAVIGKESALALVRRIDRGLLQAVLKDLQQDKCMMS